MPSASAASAVRRRNAVSLATSALCHALIFGFGALLLSRSVGKPAAAEKVVVDLVEAKPDPIRDVDPAPPDKQPVPTMPVTPRTFVARMHPKPRARAQNTAPELTVSPSSGVATAGDVALPAAAETAPRKDEIVPSSGLPSAPEAPAWNVPRPIALIAPSRYRSTPAPDYPIASKRRHEEGVVQLVVTIGPDGRPTHVSLFRSSGHPVLDQAAIDKVRGEWTFEPERASGVPVASQAIVPVRWTLSQP